MGTVKAPAEGRSLSKGKSPAPGRQGPTAAVRLLSALIRPHRVEPSNPWTLYVRSALPGSSSSRGFRFHGCETEFAALAAFLQASAAAGERVSFSPVLERDGATNQRGETPTERLLLAFVFELDLVELLRRGGSLYDDLGPGELDARGEPRLSLALWNKARAFSDVHLRNGVFQPTAVVEHGWRWLVVFALEHPAPLSAKTRAGLTEAQGMMRRLLYSAQLYASSARIDLQDLLLVGRERPSPMSLRWVHPKTRCDPERVLKVGGRLLQALGSHEAAALRGDLRPALPAMGLLTLPPDWTLEDWALCTRHRQILATGLDEDGGRRVGELGRMIEVAAKRGHGWRDVEQLLSEPRYAQHVLPAGASQTMLALKRMFRRALSRRDLNYPTRLPWGIRMARIEGQHPGELRRYRLYAKSQSRWVHRDVTWAVLSSEPQLRRAVGGMLEAVLQPVAQKVWSATLALAVKDPRCMRTIGGDGQPAPKPLTAWIVDFLRTAKPYRPPGEALSSQDPSGWPLIKDGVVVFPRRALVSFLEGSTGAGEVGRTELTRALESLGGGRLGVLYFAGSGRIRVWFCPPPRPRTGPSA